MVMKMNKDLRFQFNELGFVVNSEPSVLKKLYDFWYLSLDLSYTSKKDDDWFISIQPIDNIRAYCKVDYSNKYITFYNPCSNSIEYINSFLREFITKIFLLNGYIWLHASAFALNGKTYVVLGKKGYGKTTHLMKALSYHNAEIIGNDQVPIKIVDGNVWTFRWRPDVTLSPITLEVVDSKSKKEAHTNCDRFMLMPHVSQYTAINFTLLSALRHQTIAPLRSAEPRYSKGKCFPISSVIMLDENPKLEIEMIQPGCAHQIWEGIFRKDLENLIPQDLANWRERIPFWRDRLPNLVASREAEEKAMETLQSLFENSNVYRVSNRIDLNAPAYLDIFR